MPICLLSKNNFYSIKKPSKLNLRTLFNLDTETMTSQRELIMNDCVVLIILCCVNAKHHLSDSWINLQICTTDDGIFSLFEFWCHQMRCHSVLYCGGSFRCVRVPQAIRALLLNLHFHNVGPSKGIVFFFYCNCSRIFGLSEEFLSWRCGPLCCTDLKSFKNPNPPVLFSLCELLNVFINHFCCDDDDLHSDFWISVQTHYCSFLFY